MRVGTRYTQPKTCVRVPFREQKVVHEGPSATLQCFQVVRARLTSCRLPSIFPSPIDRTTNYDPKYEAVLFNPQSDSARPTFWPRQQVHMGPVDKRTASQHSSYRLCCTGTAYASGRQISSHSLKLKSKARLYEASPSSDITHCNVLSVCQPLYGPTSKPNRRHSSLTQRLAA